VSLQPGTELDVLPVDVGGAGSTSSSNGPAWLHIVAAWSITLVGLVFIGTLAVLGKPEPAALLVLTGVTGGGALGLTKPGGS
jgi:hypothetical protein